MQVANRCLAEDVFTAQRKEVLAQWKTGAEVDLDEAIAYHQSLIARNKNTALRLLKARADGDIVVQPRAGVATVEGNIELLRYLETEGRSDIVPSSVDSLTRNLEFARVEAGIAESQKSGKSKLNGYPVVNHGVKGSRRVVDAVGVPLQIRANAPDLRLVAEVAFAAGYSGFTSGPVFATTQYSHKTPLEESIAHWQYVFRLMGVYEAQGIPLVNDVHGSCANALTPHGILLPLMILESVLMAEQGGRNISLQIASQGTVAQDVAAIEIAPRLCGEYLRRLGYGNVELTVTLKHWSGEFPDREPDAYALIAMNTLAGVLGKVEQIQVKTIEEGIGLPTKEANAASVRMTRHLINLLRRQRLDIASLPDVRLEARMLELETRAITDAILEAGDGDAAVGLVRAFASGLVDVPFSPSSVCRGLVMIARDHVGGVRFMDPGNLPLPPEVREFHRERLAMRTAKSGRQLGYAQVVSDIAAYATGSMGGELE